ncbi:MAG: hypothetical protein ASARMPREDX12_007988 [Alectoria sarmentosa]|nr:MAG: hypothetical protein ASARMPREDX12_007988 [Alectoria sarmentosa]
MATRPARNSLVSLSPELILLIASHLIADSGGGYVFTKPRDSNTWRLTITEPAPGAFTTFSLPKRYGSRLLFQIRPVAAYAAFVAAHPYFASVILEHPPLMPSKPVTAERLVVVDEREEVDDGDDDDDAARVPGGRAWERRKRDYIYWVRERANEERKMEGWGMVWVDGGAPDDRWPLGIGRIAGLGY